MDSCLAVEKEVDSIITNLTTIRDFNDHAITDVTELLSKIKDSLDNDERAGNEDLTALQLKIITEALQNTNDIIQQISDNHRGLHRNLCKVGQVIDKHFVPDFTTTTIEEAFEDRNNIMILNKMMAKHYYRKEMYDVVETLIGECGISEETAQDVYKSEDSFIEISKISNALENYDLQPALAWASRFSNELNEKNSTLEFQLHKLAFLEIASRGIGAQAEAIAYARDNLNKFIDKFGTEIPNLMGILIYLPNGVENSPSKHLISPEIWTEVSYVFLKDACNVLGINKISALSVVIDVGCIALPILLDLKKLPSKVLKILITRDELPIEIPLGPEYRYHSIFACPILKQQTSWDNPPKKLICGHVISNEAILRLKYGSLLKCPYCPTQQDVDGAVRIWY